ncbi:amidophosphoribosyltransferase [Methanogenium organophilum]|uniref:Amidophosphoribosyltransferase n=1 Tax=Methanogenium organophilum TaxID=2199 RepID=A0A9X9S5B6_METOG|nr:amidophosphoribosyltransferase [Methanogenium organophilum]WAI02369.1 amidophosphoribosyltransferase [Methanogenium organophilum]
MCGIVGIVDSGDVSFPLYYALYALQHRGQESAGIATYDGQTLYKYKSQGLVADVFDKEILCGLKGGAGIGHVRYPTTGEKIPENIQPFTFTFRGRKVAVAHNGNLVNIVNLREEYEKRGQIFCTTTDTEVIGNIIADEYRVSLNVVEAVGMCMRRLQGSYSVVMMLDDEVWAFRDPLGIRPLCIGRTECGYMVASESVAIDALGGSFIRDVRPGELVCLKGNGIESHQIAEASHRAHCIFEYVYFARPDSVIDGRLVYDVRRNIGHSLCEEAPVEADLVSPVPDSGMAHAAGYAEESGIRYREALIKNRYMGRTFIMPTQEAREAAVRMKLNPVRGHLKDRSLILIDDSIVRGTTSRRLVNIVRDAGAREVHMRIGSPAIKAPCYLGVDMPTRGELIASDLDNGEVCSSIGATSLHHISIGALIRAIGIPKEDLCTGCLTGEYPLAIGSERCCPREVTCVAKHYQAGLESFSGE